VAAVAPASPNNNYENIPQCQTNPLNAGKIENRVENTAICKDTSSPLSFTFTGDKIQYSHEPKLINPNDLQSSVVLNIIG
jgi:hypothetical protein